jgi:tRNA (guanine37-N1)-methyltransferase
MKKIPQDIVGDIAILKFPRRTLWLTKKLKAKKFLKDHKTLKTVVEKTQGFSGELRILKTKHLAGIKTKQTTYKENDCIFKFNIDESYFSPRLSNERKVIAEEVVKLVKKDRIAPTNNKNKSVRVSKILVMFAGISPYPIVIGKKLKLAKKKALIISNELNKKANEESEKNIALNKLQNYIKLENGDAKKLPTKLKEKFDIILMPRPNLKDTFLKTALKLSKKGTTIFYHGFGTKEEVLNEIKKDAGGKIGKIKIRKAGDIGVGKWRWQAQFKVK